jgi:hypothetical protein
MATPTMHDPITITTVKVVLSVVDAPDWGDAVVEDVEVGSTDSVCVIVDLGACADTMLGAEVTVSGSLVGELDDGVDTVDDVDVDVEIWLVLLELVVVVRELESEFYRGYIVGMGVTKNVQQLTEDDVPISDVEVLPEVVDCVAEEEGELTEVTVAVSVEVKVGGGAPAPITGRPCGDRFFINRLKFA